MGNKLEIEIADAILELPMGIEAGGQQFSFYPVTLGQVLMTRKILDKIGFDYTKFASNPIGESMVAVSNHLDDVLKVIAINLMRGKDDVLSTYRVDNYIKRLKACMTRVDVATMLITVLTRDSKIVNDFVQDSGLKRDKERMKKISTAKSNKNSFVFGRRTMYGQLLDAACERYGWSVDYVLWGISYVNLQMMLADQEVSIFLSDKERKNLRMSNDREIINADDPKMKERIMAEFND